MKVLQRNADRLEISGKIPGKVFETRRYARLCRTTGTGQALSLQSVLFVNILAGQARQALVSP